ncbi:MAG: hypothetical protein ACLFTB_00440 [Desulfovibrionales bacterium]
MHRYEQTLLIRVVFVFGLLVFVLGCAHQSVRHLNKQPLTGNGTAELTMDYWTFRYTTEQTEKGLLVQGVALPKQDAIPVWAKWIDDLWMEAYLSDDRDHVLARHLRVFSSQQLDYAAGIPFSFTLTPERMGSPGPVFVTFGYRMVLTPAERASRESTAEVTGGRDVFFASEGALTRY